MVALDRDDYVQERTAWWTANRPVAVPHDFERMHAELTNYGLYANPAIVESFVAGFRALPASGQLKALENISLVFGSAVQEACKPKPPRKFAHLAQAIDNLVTVLQDKPSTDVDAPRLCQKVGTFLIERSDVGTPINVRAVNLLAASIGRETLKKRPVLSGFDITEEQQPK